MVQQLSLFASITQSQYNLTIASFSTLTGFPPVQFQSYNLISSPKTIVKYEPNSKNAQYEQYNIILKSPFDPELPRSKYREWILQINDIPSAGKRKINTQSILESNIQLHDKSQTIETILDDFEYKIENEYVIKGERFFYANNITIEIFQLLVKNSENDNEWKVLNDDSFVIKAFINVEKATDIEKLQKSSQHLLNLKTELQGLIELNIPDRNSMDSRIGLRK